MIGRTLAVGEGGRRDGNRGDTEDDESFNFCHRSDELSSPTMIMIIMIKTIVKKTSVENFFYIMLLRGCGCVSGKEGGGASGRKQTDRQDGLDGGGWVGATFVEAIMEHCGRRSRSPGFCAFSNQLRAF